MMIFFDTIRSETTALVFIPFPSLFNSLVLLSQETLPPSHSEDFTKCVTPGWRVLFHKPSTASASRQHGRTLRRMRSVLTPWISGNRPRRIRVGTCHILPLFAHFHTRTVFHFSFLDRLARLVGMMTTPAPSNIFQAELHLLHRSMVPTAFGVRDKSISHHSPPSAEAQSRHDVD
jgi:hypothetical protein